MGSKQSLYFVIVISLLACVSGSEQALKANGARHCIIPSIDDLNVSQKESEFRAENPPPEFSTQAGLTVPQLSSKPGAPVTIYLDFDGHPAHSWNGLYNVPTTPAYDRDGDDTNFVQAELDGITEIWRRVSESYSIFNVNVTTADPGSYPQNQAFKIITGGTNAWLGGGGGVAIVSLFGYPSSARWGFCFDKNLGNGNPKYVADCIAHEAGHVLGLDHQSTYSGTTLVQAYNTGDANRAPIMGVAYSSTRGLWWHGQTESGFNIIQEDIPSMLGNLNFVVASDDAGNTLPLANALNTSGLNVSGNGTIETLTDVDVFHFSTGAGTVTLDVTSATPGGTLDVSAVLKDSSGTVLATAAPSNSLSASFSTSVPAGTYYVFVSSQATNIGDLGRYTIAGVIPSAFTGATPTPAVTGTPSGEPTATPQPTAQPTAQPTVPPTATPTVRPSARLDLVSPSEGALISRNVVLKIRTNQVDLVRVSEKQGRSWFSRIKRSGEVTSTLKFRILGRASDLTIRGYSSNTQVAQQRVALRVGKIFSASKSRKRSRE